MIYKCVRIKNNPGLQSIPKESVKKKTGSGTPIPLNVESEAGNRVRKFTCDT